METILLAKSKLGEAVTLWEIVSTQDGSPGALVRQEPYMVRLHVISYQPEFKSQYSSHSAYNTYKNTLNFDIILPEPG